MHVADQTSEYDLLVIGGGINGVGIARDAVGRGLTVCLAEMRDLGSGTSSWSSKLIHGGLRYLEHYEFKLVRESLIEREVLLNAAPHLVEPLRFVMPHHKDLRPKWLLRLGLFLYDNLGGRKLLPGTTSIDLANSPLGAPLKDSFTAGFEYSDCRADDARLVVVNAMDAAARGADIFTYTKCSGAKRGPDGWTATLESERGHRTIKAKAIVNAAGPWVTRLFDSIDDVDPTKGLRMVQGSHIFTEKLFDHDRAYIFQHGDGRVVFAIPYRGDLTLIGTTDKPYTGDPADVAITQEEIVYLCDLVSEYFDKPVTPSDVVSTYSGVRPLFDDLSKEGASKVTRDYAFDLQGSESAAPILSIYGGKLTTYRKLALDALSALEPFFAHMGPSWTKEAPLPGGDMGYQGFAAFQDRLSTQFPFVPGAMRQRLSKAYGSAAQTILADATCMADLGQHFGADLYEAELVYMRRYEWARTAEDALARRSKLYLKLTEAEQDAVIRWFAAAEEL